MGRSRVQDKSGGDWISRGCELEVSAVEISRISRGSVFALFAPLVCVH